MERPAVGLDQITGVGGVLVDRDRSITGKPADVAASAMQKTVEAVDFPAFVSSLIQGVFEAIVKASMDQMTAYQQLLETAVKSTEAYVNEISDGDALGYLNSSFPGAGISLGSGQGLSIGDPSKIDMSKLGMPTSFMDPRAQLDQAKLMTQAKLQMASQKQQMLATMVLMGINRIVVTDGRINAKVRITVTGTEAVSQQTQDMVQGDITRDSQVTTRGSNTHYGFWGTSDTSNWESTQTVRTKVGTEAASQQSASSQQIKTDAMLYGEVAINFKSDTFPLEQLASPARLASVRARAVPADLPSPLPSTT
jgi:hypothetical protein